MIVQIYTIQSVAEALAIAELGVDHIGVTPSHLGLPGEIDISTSQAIFSALSNRVKKVALSVDEDLDVIERMALAVRPDILHLCGDILAVPPQAVAELRTRLPGIQIMQAIPMTGPEAVQHAAEFQSVADYLILDSKSSSVTGIGATGETHDWSISREIVEQSRIPVILAGGLTPENVSAAIRVVRPYGVDSLTHTNKDLGGGRFYKDLDRVRAFVQAAKYPFQEM